MTHDQKMIKPMFKLEDFDVKKFDAVLARGLSHGVGKPEGQMCIEAAICNVLGMDHGDDPGCVAKSVRNFKIALNDKKWSSPQARSEGLRDLGLAQLGSLGIVDDREFVNRLAQKLIRVMVPTLIRDLYAKDEGLMEVADRCEREGSRESALAVCDALRKKAYAADAAAYADAAYAAAYTAAYDAAYTAAYAAYAADAAEAAAAYAAAYAAADAADAAAYAARAAEAAAADAKSSDKYLCLGAKCDLDVLIDLKSPGCELLRVSI